MTNLQYFGKSQRKGKKYVAVFSNPKKTIHFGADGYEDYTIHKDKNRRQLYFNRHKKNENWEDPLTAGSLSRYVLWNKTTIEKSLEDYLNRFNIGDKRG